MRTIAENTGRSTTALCVMVQKLPDANVSSTEGCFPTLFSKLRFWGVTVMRELAPLGFPTLTLAVVHGVIVQ